MANVESGYLGNCEGPDSEYVKLVSSDDHEFIIKRKHAQMSNTISAMLNGPGQFSENQTNVIRFREIPSYVLERVCAYFVYKEKYSEGNAEAPDFSIPVHLSLELLMAAHFLDC